MEDELNTSVGNFDSAKRVKKDYDSYLNIYDERPVETTLQKGSDIIIHTAAPISNDGPFDFIIQRYRF